jgi:hypothetical protein
MWPIFRQYLENWINPLPRIKENRWPHMSQSISIDKATFFLLQCRSACQCCLWASLFPWRSRSYPITNAFKRHQLWNACFSSM